MFVLLITLLSKSFCYLDVAVLFPCFYSISDQFNEHYEDNLSRFKSEIQTLNVSADTLGQANTVALKWARPNFRCKLKPSTILAFELEFTFWTKIHPLLQIRLRPFQRQNLLFFLLLHLLTFFKLF